MSSIKKIIGILLVGIGFLSSQKTKAKIIQHAQKRETEPLIGRNNYPTWEIPPSGQPYAEWFHDAERIYSIPHNLLARIGYQESHFRDDIIAGLTQSKKGAIGIMQIIPRWHPDVNPLDPKNSIYYAGSYLKSLYNMFGSWQMALAAYNWGPTNLKNKGIDNAPMETRKYIHDILNDINVT